MRSGSRRDQRLQITWGWSYRLFSCLMQVLGTILGLLKEQSVFLTSDPSLQHLKVLSKRLILICVCVTWMMVHRCLEGASDALELE